MGFMNESMKQKIKITVQQHKLDGGKQRPLTNTTAVSRGLVGVPTVVTEAGRIPQGPRLHVIIKVVPTYYYYYLVTYYTSEKSRCMDLRL